MSPAAVSCETARSCDVPSHRRRWVTGRNASVPRRTTGSPSPTATVSRETLERDNTWLAERRHYGRRCSLLARARWDMAGERRAVVRDPIRHVCARGPLWPRSPAEADSRHTLSKHSGRTTLTDLPPTFEAGERAALATQSSRTRSALPRVSGAVARCARQRSA